MNKFFLAFVLFVTLTASVAVVSAAVNDVAVATTIEQTVVAPEAKSEVPATEVTVVAPDAGKSEPKAVEVKCNETTCKVNDKINPYLAGAGASLLGAGKTVGEATVCAATETGVIICGAGKTTGEIVVGAAKTTVECAKGAAVSSKSIILGANESTREIIKGKK